MACNPVPTAAPPPAAVPVDDLLRVEEVRDAEYFIGELFRRQFASPPPDYGRHFIALYRPSRSTLAAIGYFHCTIADDLWLCGGVIEDDRALGRMPAPHRHELETSGGVRSRLIHAVVAKFARAPAFWAYAGEGSVRDAFAAARFATAAPPHLMVRWNADLTGEQRQDLVRRAIALGPF